MEKREVPYLAMGGVYEEDDVLAASKVISAAAKIGGDFFPLPEENEFQEAFAKHEGAEKAVAVNSAGTALDLCMMSLGIKEGDEVITTPLTFVCSATTAIARGAKVVFADIEEETLNLSPEDVEKKITEKTKAIIPVHFSGLACDVEKFERISQKYGIPIIYDAAHAVGTKFKGKPVGGFGKASCYSFQSNKNMTTLGEGGAVTTNDADFAEDVRQKKTFGYIYGKELRVVQVGFNYRMTKPQMAVGINQINKIDRIINTKRENFIKLNKALENVPEIKPAPFVDENHGALMFVARVDSDKIGFCRDILRKTLKEDWGVGTAHHYPAVWTWEALSNLGYTNEGCSIADRASKEVISLPVFTSTTDEDIEYIIYALKESIFKIKNA